MNPMQFETVMQKYLDLMPDCGNIFLMGMDGLAVAKVTRDEEAAMSVEVFAAEYTNLLQNLTRALEHLNQDRVQEHMHITDDLYILAYFITPQYYLLMTIRSASLLGHARFQLRRLAAELADEIVSL